MESQNKVNAKLVTVAAMRRLTLGILAAATLVACAAGCVPAPPASSLTTTRPAPTADPTTVATAAEATYRAYVDATNEVDLADPATFEPVYEWLSGRSLSSSKKAFQKMHRDGLRVTGTSAITRVDVVTGDSGGIEARACLDVSDILLTDSDGNDVRSPTRLDRQPLRIMFEPGPTATGLTISRSEAAGGNICR